MNFLKKLARMIRYSCRRFPITSACMAICIGLGLAIEVDVWKHDKHRQEALHDLGAIGQLTYHASGDLPGADSQRPAGPFDVWRGEWWRIPLSAFHHGSWWHLVMNLLSLWFLGALLEPRCSRLSYLLLIAGSATVTILMQFLHGDYPVGISGTICAQLGALLIMRRNHPELNEILTPQFIAISMILLLSGLVVNQIPQVVKSGVGIANLAHFTGLAYGWLFGMVMANNGPGIRWMRISFWGAHLLIWPGLNYAVTPIFDADYHWNLGYTSDQAAEKMTHYQAAVNLDPKRMELWVNLALAHEQAGNFPSAWKACLSGLRYNRMHELGPNLIRYLWSRESARWMKSILQVQRKRRRNNLVNALSDVRNTFGDDANDWIARWKLAGVVELRGSCVLVEPDRSQRTAIALGFRIKPDRASNVGFAASLNVSEKKQSRRRLRVIPPVDIDDPQSALEGVLL